MTADEILLLMKQDAIRFYLAPGDAALALAEIVAELSDTLSADDLTTLTAIGSVLCRASSDDPVAALYIRPSGSV